MFYYLLRELHFLSIDGVKVKQPVMDSLEFAQAVVKESTDLEVLRMHGRSYPHACFEETLLSLDALCSELFNHATFLSKFRVLEIHDCAPGCIVSQEIFDQFFSVYLSAPTNHAQKVTFTDASNVADNEPQTLAFDQNYLHFKPLS